MQLQDGAKKAASAHPVSPLSHSQQQEKIKTTHKNHTHAGTCYVNRSAISSADETFFQVARGPAESQGMGFRSWMVDSKWLVESQKWFSACFKGIQTVRKTTTWSPIQPPPAGHPTGNQFDHPPGHLFTIDHLPDPRPAAHTTSSTMPPPTRAIGARAWRRSRSNRSRAARSRSS